MLRFNVLKLDYHFGFHLLYYVFYGFLGGLHVGRFRATDSCACVRPRARACVCVCVWLFGRAVCVCALCV